ncbi:MAG: hypothetical protein WBY73_14845, partial [Candidatus Acidiferrales bacterium]
LQFGVTGTMTTQFGNVGEAVEIPLTFHEWAKYFPFMPANPEFSSVRSLKCAKAEGRVILICISNLRQRRSARFLFGPSRVAIRGRVAR